MNCMMGVDREHLLPSTIRICVGKTEFVPKVLAMQVHIYVYIHVWDRKAMLGMHVC